MTVLLSVPAGYLDCSRGFSCRLLLAALLDCGLEQNYLLQELAKLAPTRVNLSIKQTEQGTVISTATSVPEAAAPQLLSIREIYSYLDQGGIGERVRSQVKKVFSNLQQAQKNRWEGSQEQLLEARTIPLSSFLYAAGAVIGIERTGMQRLTASALPLGGISSTAPETFDLLRGIPTYGVESREATIDSTGAALLTTLCKNFGPLPPMRLLATGYALENSESGDKGQGLTLLLGESTSVSESQTVEVIETNLDDWSPEGFPYLCEKLFATGALDVSLTPIHMKKGRAGFTLQVISSIEKAQELKKIIFTETTAIGVRFRQENRQTLIREMVEVSIKWGTIKAKKVYTPAGAVIYPEYEQCRQIAKKHNIPLSRIYSAVQNLSTEQG